MAFFFGKIARGLFIDEVEIRRRLSCCVVLERLTGSEVRWLVGLGADALLESFEVLVSD